MFTLAHISDVHLPPMPVPRPHQLLNKRILGYFNWHVLGRKRQHQRDALDDLVAHLKTRRYDHLALTGDLVNIALPQEFVAISRWLEALGTPENISVVPGNHDAYTLSALREGVAGWQPYMQSDAEGAVATKGRTAHCDEDDALSTGFPYVRMIGDLAIVGVSSAIPSRPFSAIGQLGEHQRQALRATLHDLHGRDLFCVLLIHHPPLPGLAGPGRDLTDAEQLGALLSDQPVGLVIHGHNHTSTRAWGQGPVGRYPVVGIPSASMGLAGHRPLARYNLYDIERIDRGWTIRLRGYGAEQAGGPVTLLEDSQLVAPE